MSQDSMKKAKRKYVGKHWAVLYNNCGRRAMRIVDTRAVARDLARRTHFSRVVRVEVREC